MDEIAFFDCLMKRTNTKGRNALERVRRASDALEASGTPITPTSIGRWCDVEGPGPGAIYNSKNHLKAYVLWRAARQTSKAKSKSGQLHDLRFSDPATQATFDTINAEICAVSAENQRLKSAFRSLAPIEFDRLLGKTSAHGQSDHDSPMPTVNRKHLTEALGKLSDFEELARLGIRIHQATGSLQMPGKVPEILLTANEWTAIKAHFAELMQRT